MFYFNTNLLETLQYDNYDLERGLVYFRVG